MRMRAGMFDDYFQFRFLFPFPFPFPVPRIPRAQEDATPFTGHGIEVTTKGHTSLVYSLSLNA